LAICGSEIAAMNPGNPTIGTLDIAGVTATAGIMVVPEPDFDPTSPEHRTSVLVNTHAFSCNYRDKALILGAALSLPPDRFYSIGSEFVATVLEIGDDVSTFRPGDRVIPDGAWPPGRNGPAGGLPTNNSSRSRQIFDHRKLVPIPDELPDEIAAGFTIGAQTSYSMVRRLRLSTDSHVLVTAARSNTALFTIQALRKVGCNVYVVSTTGAFADELRSLGVREHFVIDADVPTLMDDADLRTTATRLEGFDAVVDPFLDVHLGKVLPCMGYGARYVTCGVADQYGKIAGQVVPNVRAMDLADVMHVVMIHNLELIGNCLGTREDLQQALRDYASGQLHVQLDSVHRGGDAVGFLDRTYNAPDRFGKVVFVHASESGRA
jgi:NADPH:quinone reductase-like Zn-dependent oxidoreductase